MCAEPPERFARLVKYRYCKPNEPGIECLYQFQCELQEVRDEFFLIICYSVVLSIALGSTSRCVEDLYRKTDIPAVTVRQKSNMVSESVQTCYRKI